MEKIKKILSWVFANKKSLAGTAVGAVGAGVGVTASWTIDALPEILINGFNVAPIIYTILCLGCFALNQLGVCGKGFETVANFINRVEVEKQTAEEAKIEAAAAAEIAKEAKEAAKIEEAALKEIEAEEKARLKKEAEEEYAAKVEAKKAEILATKTNSEEPAQAISAATVNVAKEETSTVKETVVID